MAEILHFNIIVSEFELQSHMFIFRLKHLRKLRTLLFSSQVLVKKYCYCSSIRIALCYNSYIQVNRERRKTHLALGPWISSCWFFTKSNVFIFNNYKETCHWMYCPSLATIFSHLSGSIWIPLQKNATSFEANHESTHFLNFFIFIRLKVLPSQAYLPSIGTSDNWMRQSLVNMVGGVRLPI